VLAVSAKRWGCLTATGLDMIRRTSTMRWYAWIHSTQRSVMTQRFSGCASQWWSIVRCVVSLRLRASRAASEKVMASARRSVAHVVLAGNVATHKKCIASDRQQQSAVLNDDWLACRTLSLWLMMSYVLIKAVYMLVFQLKNFCLLLHLWQWAVCKV